MSFSCWAVAAKGKAARRSVRRAIGCNRGRMAYQLLALGVGVGCSRLESTSRARAQPVALDGPGPLLGVQCGRGVEPVALRIDLEPEHRRPVRAAQIELALGDQASDLGQPPTRSAGTMLRPRRGARGSRGRASSGSTRGAPQHPASPSRPRPDCVARISAAFFLRHVFAASAR